MADEKLTPMMQQYFEVKRGLAPNIICCSSAWGTSSRCSSTTPSGRLALLGSPSPSATATRWPGSPSRPLDNYVGKLLAAGKKVAICDQAEPAKAGKLVRRQLTRILSPGTTLDANQLDAGRNRYLVALALDSHGLHAAWLDLSTGEFRLASDPSIENLLPVLTALDPAEIVLDRGRPRALARRPARRRPPARPRTLRLRARSSPNFPATTSKPPPARRRSWKPSASSISRGSASPTTTPASGPPVRSSTTPRKTSAPNPRTSARLQEYRSTPHAAPRSGHPAQSRDLRLRLAAPAPAPARAINRTAPPPAPACSNAGSLPPPLDLPRSTAARPCVGELLDPA
jgi:DNA mismatch repair protein MutS